MLYQYLVIFSILLFIGIFATIKLLYPFWNLQPVVHPYDFVRIYFANYYLSSNKSFIVPADAGLLASMEDSRKRNKFCSFYDISFSEYSELDDSMRSQACFFLQDNFIQDVSGDSLFIFFPEHLHSYFAGHTFPGLVSYSFTGQSFTGPFDSFVTSRPVEFLGHNFYFVDFLCVRHSQSAYKLLQTHFIRSCRHVPEIKACIFRTEDIAAAGIVPFLHFTSSVYVLPSSTANVFKGSGFTGGMRLIFLQDKFSHIWTSVILPRMKERFSACCFASIGSLLELAKARILYIAILIQSVGSEDIVYAVYVFRDSRTVYSGDAALLHFIGSINWTNDIELFLKGFLYALKEIMTFHPGVFRYLMVDDISDNSQLMSGFIGADKSVFDTHPVYYYSYNFIVPQMKSESSIFIL